MQRTNRCSKTIFLYPVTEHKMERVSRSVKGKLSPGYDDILEYLVKQCIKQKTKKKQFTFVMLH
jgi:hypothetical protein